MSDAMNDIPKAIMLRDLSELTAHLIAIAKGLVVASQTTPNITVISLGLQAQTLLERHGLLEKGSRKRNDAVSQAKRLYRRHAF
jgi:hypothetical protein